MERQLGLHAKALLLRCRSGTICMHCQHDSMITSSRYAESTHPKNHSRSASKAAVVLMRRRKGAIGASAVLEGNSVF